MTILANHAPVMAALRPGVVTVTAPGGKAQRLFVRGGFADINTSGFTLLAEQSLPIEEPTPPRSIAKSRTPPRTLKTPRSRKPSVAPTSS